MRYRVRVLVLALFALDVMGAVQTSCFSPTLGVPNAVPLGRALATPAGRSHTLPGKAAVPWKHSRMYWIGGRRFFLTMRRACVTWMLGADGGGELVVLCVLKVLFYVGPSGGSSKTTDPEHSII